MTLGAEIHRGLVQMMTQLAIEICAIVYGIMRVRFHIGRLFRHGFGISVTGKALPAVHRRWSLGIFMTGAAIHSAQHMRVVQRHHVTGR